jgi:thioredoxin-like negative regulator of GroEL
MACLVYLNALNNPFVYDDRLTVAENPSLRQLGKIRAVLLHDLFRPVVNLSYAVDFAVWGLQPFGFHLTSLLLHGLNIVLLFSLARRVAIDAGAESAGGDIAGDGIAFTAATLLAVHPLMTEAVGYVSGRSELLCGIFFMTSLLCLRSFLLTWRPLALVAGLVTWVAALASKELAIVLPVLLLAWDRWLLPDDQERRRARLLRFHLPVLALMAVAGAIRVASFIRVETTWELGSLGLNTLVESVVVWRYIGLLLLPVSQSIVHDVRIIESFSDPVGITAMAGLVTIATALWRARSRLPWLSFGGTWFLLLLAPSHIIPLAEPMAEHRCYLAGCGAFLVCGFVAVTADRWWRLRHLGPVVVPRVVLCLILVVLSLASIARNRIWADKVTLWSDAASKAPKTWAPHYALADELRLLGRYHEAIPVYRRAIKVLPDQPEAYMNLGICLAESGQHDEAAETFHHALEVDPTYVKAYNNLAMLAMIRGDGAEAHRLLMQALEHEPNNLRTLLTMANLYERSKQPATALRICQEAQKLSPGTPGIKDCIERNRRRLQSSQQGQAKAARESARKQ